MRKLIVVGVALLPVMICAERYLRIHQNNSVTKYPLAAIDSLTFFDSTTVCTVSVSAEANIFASGR